MRASVLLAELLPCAAATFAPLGAVLTASGFVRGVLNPVDSQKRYLARRRSASTSSGCRASQLAGARGGLIPGVSSTSRQMASCSMVAPHGADTCIFCKIRDGRLPSYKVLETEHALAFLDVFPMARGHTLLIPKKHYAFLSDMPSVEAAAVLQELPRLVTAVQNATGSEGVNVTQNNGAAAGQVVFHVHFHIIPRESDDGLVRYGKSGAKVAEQEGQEVKSLISQHL